MSLNELWAGHIYGTNTGKVFLELLTDGDQLAGTLKLADDQFGVTTLTVSGKVEGDDITLEGEPLDTPEEVSLGKVNAIAKLKPDGTLSGEWKSEIGTAGIFQLFPHFGARFDLDHADVPEQIYTKVRDVGALRLYRSDLLEILDAVKRKFPGSKVVVTHLDRGAELARYVDDFEKSLDKVQNLKWIKINAQAADKGNLRRVITIDLGQAFNRVTTQGPDEAWVLGEAEATASFLREREKRLSTAIGKYRIGFNQVIALCALIAMPNLNIVPRAVFVLLVIVVLFSAQRIQNSLIPNLIINISEQRPNWIGRAWPSVVSWLISMSAAVAASGAYALLAKAFG